MMDGQLRNVLPSGTTVYLSNPAPGSIRKSLLDPSNETPWQAPSLPATIHLEFPQPVDHATHVALTFQGGFVGTEAMIYVASTSKGNESEIEVGLSMGGKIYPEDKNKRQVFKIVYPPNSQHPPLAGGARSLPSIAGSVSGPRITTEVPANPQGGGRPAHSLINGVEGELDPPSIKELKIEFEKSSDQYGRVTLYSIELLG